MADKKYETKKSGETQEFSTGAHRDKQTGKGRYDLIPPTALKRLADLYERGAEAYGVRNWEKGMNLSRFVDSALRHLFQYLEGKRDEDHLAAVVWNVMGLIHIEELIERGLLPEELIDLPDYTKK